MAKRFKSLKLKSLLFAIVLLGFTGQTLAALMQSAQSPTINVQACAFNAASGRLTIKGANFQKGATVTLMAASGQVHHAGIKIKNAAKIYVNEVAESEIVGGIDVTITNPDGSTVSAHLDVMANDDSRLTDADVKQVIAQAAAQADASGLKVTIAVSDKEGNVLGVFTMNGASPTTMVTLPNRGPRGGIEGVTVPACTAAISKAVTGAFLSSQGHAFSTRTASFIVQEHFPPGVNFQSSGPLFGVQFSQLLCSDVNARAPLGLSADPGGLPLYKNGLEVGGVGIEGDGHYTLDPDPSDKDVPPEEVIALAATRNFEAPAAITGDKIIVNGIRFPYVNATMPAAITVPAFGQLNGSLNTCLSLAPAAVRGNQPSKFKVITLDSSIPAGRVHIDDGVHHFFPFKSGSALSAAEVQQLIVQAAQQAFKTRAAIRQPENSAAEVNITVCDTDGTILGIFSTIDAPIFGFDVSAQKARTAAFFSNASAATRLRQAGFGNYVDAAAKDGLKLDGSVAFSDRAGGFLSRPSFPDGIDDTENGPFSKPIDEWSPFNDGLQLDLVKLALTTPCGGPRPGRGEGGKRLPRGIMAPGCPCTAIPEIRNGIQIFAAQ